MRVKYEETRGLVSDITLKRTDTTLDQSQRQRRVGERRRERVRKLAGRVTFIDNWEAHYCHSPPPCNCGSRLVPAVQVPRYRFCPRWPLADRPQPKIAPLESGRHGLGTIEQTGLCQVAELHADWQAHYLVNKRGPYAKALLGFRKLNWRRGSHQQPNVLTTQDSTDRPVQIGAMRVIELIIDGFKSYAVRTVVSGW